MHAVTRHWLAAVGLFGAVFCAPGAAQDTTGEQIYKSQCATCHGTSGEGTLESYPHRLAGDRTIAELARLIQKTMPEDDPGSLSEAEARLAAEYIYNAFYSRAAQTKFAPVRIELSRLTVRQYQNAVTDLVGSFRRSETWGPERGLPGEYYKSRRPRGRDRELERRDATINFQFGEQGPLEGKIDPKEYSIRWAGSVMAPDTGEYEFIVKTENGFRLWVNDPEAPLIDNGVKSGTDTEYRQTIRLLGGRPYFLKLEYMKANEKTGSIALEWKLPHRPAELIPERCLSPQQFPEAFVLKTPFPPDDRSIGYERGTSISKEWDRATTEAAIEVAAYVTDHLRDLSGIKEDAGDRTERLKDFAKMFVERAFRRPLTEDQRPLFVDRHFEGTADPALAVKRVVLLALKSPRFLYREMAAGPSDAHDVASRIAFGLWDSLPDAKLLEAAAGGQLTTREQVVAQVDRMQPDPRTRSKLREFLLQWLKVEHVPDVSKDPQRYPEFSAVVASDLRTSLDLFLDDVVWSEASDFRRLLLAEEVWLNGRLAQVYGSDLPEDAPFQKVLMSAEERAGVLSHPYLMAGFAYTASSSPIHRGVFIARSVLGRSLRPPPEAVAPLAPELQPELTTRERVALQTKPESCQACHAMINPLGFTLERYDAVGRFRKEEQGKPIDSTGAYRTRTGDTVQFAGVRELAEFLAHSEETHQAFVEQLFHYLVKQPLRAHGPETLPRLRESFKANEFHIRKLVIEILATSSGGGFARTQAGP